MDRELSNILDQADKFRKDLRDDFLSAEHLVLGLSKRIGISADEIRQFAFLAGSSPSVIGADITEIDSTKDSSDERTVRLAALVVLELIAGYSTRE